MEGLLLMSRLPEHESSKELIQRPLLYAIPRRKSKHDSSMAHGYSVYWPEIIGDIVIFAIDLAHLSLEIGIDSTGCCCYSFFRFPNYFALLAA